MHLRHASSQLESRLPSEGGRTGNRNPCRRAGYSLLELSVVVLVVGILAAVAAPKVARSQHHFRCEAAARRIAADLTYVRNAASSEAASKTLAFVPATDQYQAATVKSLDRPANNLDVALADTAYPADITAASFAGSNSVTFNIFGIPSAPGTVSVASGEFVGVVNLAADGTVSLTLP